MRLSFNTTRRNLGFAVVLFLALLAALATPRAFANTPVGSAPGAGSGTSGASQSNPGNPSAYLLQGDYNQTGSSTTQVNTVGYNAIGLSGIGANGPSSQGVHGEGYGIGTYGYSPAGTGLKGESGSGVALFGVSGSGSGFYGFSSNGPGGVMGSQTSQGALFYTRNPYQYALHTGGASSGGGYGDAYLEGGIEVDDYVWAYDMYAYVYYRRVSAANNAEKYVYNAGSTRNTVSDEGTARLVNGRAVVSIATDYADAVNLADSYQVFVTPNSADTAGLAVVNKTATSFEVRELNKGQGNFSFDWRIDAVQKGNGNERMPASPAGSTLRHHDSPNVQVPSLPNPLFTQNTQLGNGTNK